MLNKAAMILLIVALMTTACMGCESQPDLTGKTVLIVVLEGFEPSAVSDPIAYFRRQGAKVIAAGFKTGRTSSYANLTYVDIDVLVDDVTVDMFDALVLPGLTVGSAPGVPELLSLPGIEDKVVAAICTAVPALARAGLLVDKRATGENFRIMGREGPVQIRSSRFSVESEGGIWVDDEAVVRDQNIVTAQGLNSPYADTPILINWCKAIAEALVDER